MMLALGAAFWLELDGVASAATTVGILALQTRGLLAVPTAAGIAGIIEFVVLDGADD